MSIVNRTPHALTLIPAGAPADTPPSATIEPGDRGSQARVLQDCRDLGPAPEDLAVHLTSGSWGRIVGLAPPQDGVLQVVSVHVVLAAVAAGRTLADLAIPGDQVRGAGGRIVACRGLTRGAEAFPRAPWQRLPRVVVFGSAARWVLDRAELFDRQFHMRAPLAHKDFEAAVAALPLPGDVDVAYVGMDEAAAREIVTDWLRGSHLPPLPLDLHCLPGEDDGIVLPRPARIEEDESIPLDDAMIAVFGGAEGVVFEDVRSLPAILRRAAKLLEAGWAVPEAARAVVAAARRQRWDILVGEGGDRQDCYLGSSTAALRRAIAKLDVVGGPAMRLQLGAAGFPVEVVWHLAHSDLHWEAVESMRRGAPSTVGAPLVRLTSEEGHWTLGPVHAGPTIRGSAETIDHFGVWWIRAGVSALPFCDAVKR